MLEKTRLSRRWRTTTLTGMRTYNMMWDRHLLKLSRLAQSSLASFTNMLKGRSSISERSDAPCYRIANHRLSWGYWDNVVWEIRSLSVLRCIYMENCLKMVPARLLHPRQRLRWTRPFSACAPIMFPFLAGYHLFTLVYNGELVSSCPTV